MPGNVVTKQGLAHSALQRWAENLSNISTTLRKKAHKFTYLQSVKYSNYQTHKLFWFLCGFIIKNSNALF